MDFAYFWKEWTAYLNEKYFSPDLTAIENYDTTDIQRFLPLLIVGVCIGTFLATCISYYHGHYLGSVVRNLYKRDAFTPESALPLSEIGCDKLLIRRSLARDSVLAKYVKPVGDAKEKGTAFYILEEQKYIADKRFKSVRFGKWMLLWSFLLCTAACFVLLYLTPDMLQLLDNAITLFGNG